MFKYSNRNIKNDIIKGIYIQGWANDSRKGLVSAILIVVNSLIPNTDFLSSTESIDIPWKGHV